MHEKSVTRISLGAFFWAPIPFKQYQNTCGYDTMMTIFSIVSRSLTDLVENN